MPSHSFSTDTIEVRPDERFNSESLAAYLKDKLEGADRPLAVRQFGGGAANLTYLLDYGTHEYVLRRPPLGPVARSAHDMARESRVLSVLYKAFPYAPRAFLYCEDPSVIGSDFFVMERKRGLVVRKTMPEVYQNRPEAPRQMAFALVDALVDLHAVDYKALGLGDLGRPDGFIERQIEGWYRRWHRAKVDDLPDMDTAYQWLKAHLPKSTSASLVHNDYKLDNVMLDPDDPGNLIAVFDWDMCTLGDPFSDLGALLTYWITPDDPDYFKAISMMPLDSGFPGRDELVTRYAARSGRDVSQIAFYHSLGLFRLTVILAQIYIRYKKGQTRDQRFEALGPMVPLTARASVEVAKEG